MRVGWIYLAEVGFSSIIPSAGGFILLQVLYCTKSLAYASNALVIL